MAFKASNIIPSDAYQVVKRAATQLKLNCQGFVSTLQASGADYNYLRDIYLTLVRAKDQLNTLSTTPGLAAYAQDQENDPAYDVAAEFTGMLAAITGAITWMDTNVPTSVTAKSPAEWSNNESMIVDTFSSGVTAGLRTALNAVVAEID